jgi:Domain of unknown function (DUF4129)
MPSPPEPRPRRLPSALAALPALAALAALPRPVRAAGGADPEAVRRAVEEVFADPALRPQGSHGGGVSIAEYLQLLFRRFLAWVREFFTRLSEENPLLFYLIFALLVFLLLLLLAHIAWTLSLAFRGPRGGAGDGEAALDSPAARARRFQELRQEALGLAREGCYREAIRTLLLALLSLVEERRALAVSRGWTNREVLARLRLGAGNAALAESFAGTFDRAWYGGAAGGQEDFDRCADFVDQVAGELREARSDGRR